MAHGKQPGDRIVTAGSGGYLFGSWVAFAVALSVLLIGFFVNIRAYTVEIVRIEDALHEPAALDRPNLWTACGKGLYMVSASAFLLGVVLLVIFCTLNFSI